MAKYRGPHVDMQRFWLPGYEMQLLEELQRQQNSAQFCDTLLQTEGISVPTHSCVLAALSPYLSRKLSAAPCSPPGQKQRLRLQAVNAQTLLKLVGLLYSGRLEVRGSVERNDVLAAAHRFGMAHLVKGREDEKWRGNCSKYCVYGEAGARGGTRDAQVQAGAVTEEAPAVRRRFVSTGTQTVRLKGDSAVCGQSKPPTPEPPPPAAPFLALSRSLPSHSAAPARRPCSAAQESGSPDPSDEPMFLASVGSCRRPCEVAGGRDARAVAGMPGNTGEGKETAAQEEQEVPERRRARARMGMKSLATMKHIQHIMETTQISIKVKLRRRRQGEAWEVVSTDESLSLLTSLTQDGSDHGSASRELASSQAPRPAASASPQPPPHRNTTTESRPPSSNNAAPSQDGEPAPPPPPHPRGPVEEEPDEQMEKLLADIMMGLNILPNVERDRRRSGDLRPIHDGAAAADCWRQKGHSSTDSESFSSAEKHRPGLDHPAGRGGHARHRRPPRGRPRLSEHPRSLKFPRGAITLREDELSSSHQDAGPTRRPTREHHELTPQPGRCGAGSCPGSRVRSSQIPAELKSDPRGLGSDQRDSEADSVASQARRSKRRRNSREAASCVSAQKQSKVADGTESRIALSGCSVRLPRIKVLAAEHGIAAGSSNMSSKYEGRPNQQFTITEGLKERTRGAGRRAKLENTCHSRSSTRGFLRKPQGMLGNTSAGSSSVKKTVAPKATEAKPLVKQERARPPMRSATQQGHDGEGGQQTGKHLPKTDLEKPVRTKRRGKKRVKNGRAGVDVVPLKRTRSAKSAAQAEAGDDDGAPLERTLERPRRTVTLKEFQKPIKRQHLETRDSTENQGSNEGVGDKGKVSDNGVGFSKESTGETKTDKDAPQLQDRAGTEEPQVISSDAGSPCATEELQESADCNQGEREEVEIDVLRYSPDKLPGTAEFEDGPQHVVPSPDEEKEEDEEEDVEVIDVTGDEAD